MSTKTLRKRIALVAVSALGFGLVSAAPSSAAASALLAITQNVATASTTGTVGRAVAIPIRVTATITNPLSTDAVATQAEVLTFTPTVTSTPAGSAVAVANSVARGNNAAAVQNFKVWAVPAATAPGTGWGVPAATASAATITTTAAVAAVGDTLPLANKSLGTLYFVGDLAGTYVLTLDTNGSGAASVNGTAATVTVTLSTPTASAITQRTAARLDMSDVSIIQAAGYVGLDPKLQFVSGPSDQTAFTSGTVFTTGNSGRVTGAAITTGVRNYSIAWNSTSTNGTYVFRTFDDVDGSGTFNTADGAAVTHTLTVADDAKGAGSFATQFATASTDGSADVSMLTTGTITDGAGVTSYLAIGATVAADETPTVTMGALTADTTPATGVSAGEFGWVSDGLGGGRLYIDGAVAVGAYLVTMTGPGGTPADHGASATVTVLRTGTVVTGMTAVGNANLVFDATNNGVADNAATTATITASTAAGTITYNFSGATYAAGGQVAVTVAASGTTGAGDLTAPANVAVRPDGTGTFTVTNAAPSTGDKYTITLPKTGGTIGFVVTYAAPAPAWSAVSVSPAAAFTVKTGSTNTVSAVLANGFGVASAASSVTVTVAGRNPSTSLTTTSATGLASFTLVDAGAVATATTDTVTFSHPFINSLGNAATATTTFTITYTATGIVVGTVLVTPGNSARTVDTVQALGVVGAGAIVTYTATVADSAGLPLTAGNVVTWTGGAADMFVGGVQRSATNALGEATIRVYRNLIGLGTITATIGGVSGSSNTVLWSNAAGDARNVVIKAEPASVVSAGTSTITATVTDRWGNPVPSIAVTFAELGAGRLSATAASTNTAGIASVDFTSNAGETGTNSVSVRLDTAAQSLDLAGFVGSAAIAGVTAGNRTATTEMTITKDTSTSTADALLALATALGTRDQASAAVDAAAEATDAANAATDAANAAAEAADAATAAAQDAADAVAALSTQVSEMVAALKKQITSLTNLVIKIQKKVRA
jgi:trimeric autotransporter adhesin